MAIGNSGGLPAPNCQGFGCTSIYAPLLLAATALRYQATLVTRNLREFAPVPGLQCLDWHQD